MLSVTAAPMTTLLNATVLPDWMLTTLPVAPLPRVKVRLVRLALVTVIVLKLDAAPPTTIE